MHIENCEKKTVKPFCDAVNAAINEVKKKSNFSARNVQDMNPIKSDDDAISKLKRLAALKEKGILTEEEFAAQKSKILAAM